MVPVAMDRRPRVDGPGCHLSIRCCPSPASWRPAWPQLLLPEPRFLAPGVASTPVARAPLLGARRPGDSAARDRPA